MRKDFASLRRDEDHVLNPHSSLSREVYSRFDGNDAPRLKHHVSPFAESRKLMDLKPDAMAERMIELVPVSRFSYDIARDGVKFPARLSGRNRCNRRLLRRKNRAVYPFEFVRHAVHEESPCQV